jgi:hypothetical protein
MTLKSTSNSGTAVGSSDNREKLLKMWCTVKLAMTAGKFTHTKAHKLFDSNIYMNIELCPDKIWVQQLLKNNRTF